MTEHNHLASLFAACWKDESLKDRLMSDPKAVLSEFDLPVPDGVDVTVVENSDNRIHITLPARPAKIDHLTDAELSMAAGGASVLPGKGNTKCNHGHWEC